MAKKFQDSRGHRPSLQNIFNKMILVTTLCCYVATGDLKFKSKNINVKVSKILQVYLALLALRIKRFKIHTTRPVPHVFQGFHVNQIHSAFA